jgi:carbon monoxide dehydrogenase subunit G
LPEHAREVRDFLRCTGVFVQEGDSHVRAEYKFELTVPVERLWPTLLDLGRIAPCLPGASIDSGENDEYVGRIRVKLGPIEMNYRGTIRLTKRDDAAHEALFNATAKKQRVAERHQR